jgi:ParB family chromosome partitioning protein
LSHTEGLIQEVPVEDLSPSPFQPRTEMEEESLSELVESIRTHGILQPLVARRNGPALELIAGERRLQAARRAGLQRVPVVVREASDQEMLELALVENLQREDINPMEAAEAYRRLTQEFSLTQEQVAERVGKSRPAVANSLRLLKLPEPVRESLRQGEIDEGHGKVLAGLRDERVILRLWRRVVRRNMSVRNTADAAAKLAKRRVPRGTSHPREALDPNLQDLQDQLTSKLGARIRLKRRGEGGIIEIPYADAEDLDRVFWALMG